MQLISTSIELYNILSCNCYSNAWTALDFWIKVGRPAGLRYELQLIDQSGPTCKHENIDTLMNAASVGYVRLITTTWYDR